MNLENLVGGTTGWVHLLASVVALISGMFVLLSPKGTARHRRIGYFYSVSMVILLATSFFIYRLFGRFGIFHGLAILSSATLLAGLLPMLRGGVQRNIEQHLSFMYWSVAGLYAAFVAEVFVRLPRIILTPDGEPMFIFYKMVGWAVGLVMAVAIFFFIRHKARWAAQFSRKKSE